MTQHQQNKLSGDIFSFPHTPIQEQDFDFNSEFEFGCITPESPSTDPYKSSPADHLFFNGRLLPHSFPLQPSNLSSSNNSRTTSRGSSVSSRDSLMSSRSNSTNSRSSSCSSARTSSSDNSERKLLYQKYQINNSRRWQFISPGPVLNREISRKRKVEAVAKQTEKKMDGRLGYGQRLLRWFLFACKECHALEPSKKDGVYCDKISV